MEVAKHTPASEAAPTTTCARAHASVDQRGRAFEVGNGPRHAMHRRVWLARAVWRWIGLAGRHILKPYEAL